MTHHYFSFVIYFFPDFLIYVITCARLKVLVKQRTEHRTSVQDISYLEHHKTNVDTFPAGGSSSNVSCVQEDWDRASTAS